MSFRLRWQRMQQNTGWPFSPGQTLIGIPLFMTVVSAATIACGYAAAYFWSHY